MMRWWWLGLVMGCVDFDAPVDASRPERVVFEVPAGSTASGLTSKLEAEGLVSAGWHWKLFLRNEDASCLKAGKFALQRSMSMREMLKVMCGAPLVEDEPFTVLEGWRIRDIDEALVDKGWITAGDYTKLASTKAVTVPFDVKGPTLEGYLFPETYRVIPDKFEAKAFIERQLQTFKTQFLDEAKLEGRSLHDVVIMASMLEREEPKPSQRKVVAGVLYKRLDADWNLGVDATSRYTLDVWNDRKAFLKKLRDEGDVYNTRLRGGLPPTAIGNPGIESLEAALSPEESPWWYYLHDSSGTFHGGRNAKEHEANRRKYNVY